MMGRSVHDITLSCLLNPGQLAKLNKSTSNCPGKTLSDKANEDNLKPKLMELFRELLDGNIPDNLPLEITNSHAEFVKKSLYYLNLTQHTNENEDEQGDNYEDEQEDNYEDEQEDNYEDDNDGSDGDY